MHEYPGLHYQPDHGRSRGPVIKIARRILRAQFGCPTGFLGSIAGRIMAGTASNHDRIQWTLSLLSIRPDDRVLEIGFGPGIAVQLASRIATEGFIAGIDHSDVMVKQASKRNAKAIREGNVALRRGSAADTSVFDGLFDKIFTINSIHFWNEPLDCLKGLREKLKAGGVIAVTIQPRSRGATNATTEIIGAEMVANLESSGFSNCRLAIRKMTPISAACALGVR